MKNLMTNCSECNGDGYVTVDLNDTHIPYEQKEANYTCMSCSGKGYELDKDELKEKIDAINDMIQGMQVRMRMHSDFIIQLKKGLLPELAEKYIYKLDISAMALGRLLNYKRKLYNLAE